MCAKAPISADDEVSLCCEMLVDASSAGEIYLGVAPHRHMRVSLEGPLYNRCAGWLGLRMSDGGVWSGVDAEADREEQRRTERGRDGQRAPEAERDREGQLLGCQSWMHKPFTPGAAAFVAPGDRIRLDILPTTDALVVWKNGVEQGRLPLPELTRVALCRGQLRWVVTMAHAGDAVRISFPKSARSPPEPLDPALSLRPVDAGISYRRLVRHRVCGHEVVGSEVIYEVLFLASAPELKRFGVGTLLVNQLKNMLAEEQLEPRSAETGVPLMKRSLCVSIKSASKEALSFWTAMGLSPVSTEDPAEKELIDLMVPFADFTPFATAWAHKAAGCHDR